MEIVARNTSSSSIHIEWDEVPYWDQNGIITKYKIYISKHMSMSGSKKHSVTDKFHSINGLDIWEFYYIQVSALTAIGEGPKSNVTGVRTDEDSKSVSLLVTLLVFLEFVDTKTEKILTTINRNISLQLN